MNETNATANVTLAALNALATSTATFDTATT
jgi:hypothetical protein